MLIITFVTDNHHPHFRNVFVRSCSHNRLDLVVLTPHPAVMKIESLYRNWSRYFGYRPKFRFIRKYKAMRKFLKRLPRDELVLFTDSYDAVMLATEEEIVEKYRSFGSSIVFSAENNCHPPGHAERFPPSSTSLRFLNSGGYMGPAGALVDAFDQISARGYVRGRSDQLAWQRLFLDCDEGIIALDREAKLFLCLAVGETNDTEGNVSQATGFNKPVSVGQSHITDRVTFESKRAIFVETGQRPCQLHFNGKTRRLLQEEWALPVTSW